MLWNIFYDDLLRLPFPHGIKLVCFANDLAMVVMSRNAGFLEELANPALDVVYGWMKDNGLEVCPTKSEAVVLTKKWAYRNPAFFVNGHPILVKKFLKYLGVQLDNRLNLNEHVAITTVATRKLSMALVRLMPNVGVPSARSRKLLMSVVDSKLLHAAPIWAQIACMTAKNREALTPEPENCGHPHNQVLSDGVRHGRTVPS